MAIGRNSVIILHQNTCKYSFTTLTCQAEDNVFMFGGLNCLHYGIESGHTTRSYTTPVGCILTSRLGAIIGFGSVRESALGGSNYCQSSVFPYQ